MAIQYKNKIKDHINKMWFLFFTLLLVFQIIIHKVISLIIQNTLFLHRPIFRIFLIFYLFLLEIPISSYSATAWVN